MKDEKNLSFPSVRPSTITHNILPVSCDAFKPSLYPTTTEQFFLPFLLNLFLFFFSLQWSSLLPVRVFTIIFSSLSAFKAASKVSTQYSKAPTGNTTWQARSIFHTKKQNDITQRNEKQTPHLLTCYTLVHNALENRKGRGFGGKCVGLSSFCRGGAGLPLHAPQQ